MKFDTEDFVRHDACSRFETWSRRYELPRISLSDALRSGLRAGLLTGDPQRAHSQFIAHASNPGLDIEGRNVYDIAIHHAAMLEVIATYLVGNDGPWKPASCLPLGQDTFQPLSFEMPDGRLRRVVLASSWNTLREQEERHSWWSVADMEITGRPMLINAIVIGQTREGFRISPWTMGYEHPENGILRIKKKEGKFNPNWKKVKRENTDIRSLDWLSHMQSDGAFEDVVFSFTADLKSRDSDMERMASEIREGRDTMRRSACFRMSPCPMASTCHDPKLIMPTWREKGSFQST